MIRRINYGAKCVRLNTQKINICFVTLRDQLLIQIFDKKKFIFSLIKTATKSNLSRSNFNFPPKKFTSSMMTKWELTTVFLISHCGQTLFKLWVCDSIHFDQREILLLLLISIQLTQLYEMCRKKKSQQFHYQFYFRVDWNYSTLHTSMITLLFKLLSFLMLCYILTSFDLPCLTLRPPKIEFKLSNYLNDIKCV